MNKVSFRRAAVTAIISAAIAPLAAADPPDLLRDYRFITSHSTIHVSGGFPGYDLDLAIAGRLGVVTGYDYGVDPTTHFPTLVPYAAFVDVKAIVFNPLSLAPIPVPGWDLDKTLNLSGLEGTFQLGDPNHLLFRGEDGQGQPLRITATIHDKLLHIVGENNPTCCDFLHYQINAFAHLAPYPDFNFDGVMNAADYVLWRKAAGSQEEYDAWLTDFGTNIEAEISAAMTTFGGSAASTAAIPEPAALTLLICGLMGLSRGRWRARR